ncbi:MAG: hypothetical protein C4539_00490 [Ignavibacteriales bacterium]|nr:MAG: hypothetical protein C4539_00490 [Ignavibacteriales bacterium]
MYTNYFIKISILIFLIFSFSCTNKNNKRLVVDELFISEHQLGPPINNDTLFSFNPENLNKKKYCGFLEPCLRGVKISRSTYYPRLIIKVNSSGRLLGYFRECPKEGYLSIVLSDSLLEYFNKQIEKMNFRKLNSIYDADEPGWIYDGPEYFISIKDENEEKQVMILKEHKGPRNIIKFIDSIYNLVNRLELSNSNNAFFRKDTLIVLKTEEHWKNTDSIFAKIF